MGGCGLNLSQDLNLPQVRNLREVITSQSNAPSNIFRRRTRFFAYNQELHSHRRILTNALEDSAFRWPFRAYTMVETLHATSLRVTMLRASSLLVRLLLFPACTPERSNPQESLPSMSHWKLRSIAYAQAYVTVAPRKDIV